MSSLLTMLTTPSLLYIGPGGGTSFWGQVLFVLGFVALLVLALRSKGGG